MAAPATRPRDGAVLPPRSVPETPGDEEGAEVSEGMRIGVVALGVGCDDGADGALVTELDLDVVVATLLLVEVLVETDVDACSAATKSVYRIVHRTTCFCNSGSEPGAGAGDGVEVGAVGGLVEVAGVGIASVEGEGKSVRGWRVLDRSKRGGRTCRDSTSLC